MDRIQRIMLAAPRPEPVRKIQKVLFPDLVENLHHRRLYDFVFQRCDSQWPLLTISFRYPDSSRRFRLIGPAMDPYVEVDQSILQSVSIFLPRHSVHPFRRMPVQAVVAAAEQIDIDMVQQGGELHLLVPAALRTRSSPLGPLSRLCVRHGLSSSAFSLVNGLSSTISFGPPLLSFDRFLGTVPLYDFLPPFAWVL